ncbi:MAG: hypothetical protein WBF71_05035 [Microthrixaceae bacterium]
MTDFEGQIVNVGGGSPSTLKPLSFEKRMSEIELEEAFCRNPSLFGEDLLLLGRQLIDFAEDNRRLDVLALDKDGEKVLVEFKVDSGFGFTELQALAYAGAYANVENEFFPQILDRSVASGNLPGIEQATGLVETSSLDDVTSVFLSFLGIGSLDDWDPSKQVRIKVIAPDFPVRVLHNIKWLSEVYEMPIEAVQVELFEIGGDYHLKADRIFPLPGAERFELSLRERETSKRKKNVRRNKPVLALLVNEGLLKDGDRIRLQVSSFQSNLRPDIAAIVNDDDPRLSVTIDEANPSKVLWRSSTSEEPRLVSPASLPAEIANLLLGTDPTEVFGVGVADNYIDEKTGKKLEEIARDAGLWE